MKKFLSVLMALLMVLSVLMLAGCKNESTSGDETEESMPKTNAELFVYAYEQIMTPEMLDGVIGNAQIKDANHITLGVDKLEVSGVSGSADDKVFSLPEIAVDCLQTGDQSGIADVFAKLGDEKLGITSELTEDGKLYLSMPDATDKYIVTTIEQIKELSDISADDEAEMNQALEIMSAVLSKLEGVGDFILKEENLTKETADASVFGESVTLDKLTLKLDRDAILDIAEEFVGELMEVLPEEVTGGEMPDFDELRQSAEEALELDFEISFYLDGNEVKKLALDASVEAEGEAVELTGEIDILDTAEAYKLKGDIKVIALGEEMVKFTIDDDVTLTDGKLNGKMKITPKFNLEAMEAPTEAAAILENIEIGYQITGELTEGKLDADVTYEFSVGGIAIKLPVAVKIETADGKVSYDIDVDFEILTVGLDLSVSLVLEKLDDVKAGSYDPDNAVSIDDEDAMNELGEEITEYLDGLDDFAAFIESINSGNEYDDGYNEDGNNGFSIFNDELRMTFFSDGTGQATVDFELEHDAAAGTFTAYSINGDEAFVITLTGDETAEINGIDFKYELYTYDDGDVDYNFYSDETEIEFAVSPWMEAIQQFTYFEYTMDETTITINGASAEYTIDEDEEIMILDGEEYSYYAY